MIDSVLLGLFVLFTLGGAVATITMTHPMHVAIGLITAMVGLGAIYGLLGVHVIAVFQILIYVSAVMVFIVYVIMLLDTRDPSFSKRFSRLLVPAILVAAFILVGLVGAMAGTRPRGLIDAAKAVSFGMREFSVDFLREYWLHFELTSVLLLAAVVAAVAVIKGERGRRG
ncbi:MAG: NADH-quinone oxidoreductase subunit J [Burkholderiaceae bacterium]